MRIEIPKDTYKFLYEFDILTLENFILIKVDKKISYFAEYSVTIQAIGSI